MENIYKNIYLLLELSKSELKTKYKNAFLGFLWILFEPFFIMLILYIVFSRIMRFNMEYYPLYLLSGITTWRIFVNATTSGLSSLYRNRDIILRVNIPRMLIPASAVVSAVITGFFEFIVYIIIYIILKRSFDPVILMFIPFLAVYSIFVLGVANILSVIYVFFRDIKPAWNVLLQALFFLCPIFYPLSIIPYNYMALYLINPLAVFVISFHKILYSNTLPDLTILLNSLFFAVGIYVLSIMIVKIQEKKIVKRI